MTEMSIVEPKSLDQSIQIFADQAVKDLLRNFLKTVVPPDISVAVVQLEMAPLRSRFVGFDNVIEIAPKGIPVIMLSFADEGRLSANPKWHISMGYPNVAFCMLPFSKEELKRALDEARAMERPADSLAARLVETPQDARRILLHDLNHLARFAKEEEIDLATFLTVTALSRKVAELSGETILAHIAKSTPEFDETLKALAERWMYYREHAMSQVEMAERFVERASRLFGDLSFRDMLDALEQDTQPELVNGPFAGEHLDGIFVDIEGTLLLNGTPNHPLVEVLREECKRKPITLWTNGDIKALGADLRSQGIYWKIAPKTIFTGAIVEIAYDDMPIESFKALGLAADEYRQIG